TAALVLAGHDPAVALAAVVSAHAVKTAYSLVAGAVSTLVPSPGLWGRFRLGRRPLPQKPLCAVPPEAPVVLFLPAHNEEESVAEVVSRVPASVHGRPVHCLVVDDGSSDATASRAARAGAEVISLGRNRGLGAAVRRGMEEALERNPAAVAFCDADGEYGPEELGTMVAPVLAGEADYVVGSRFQGEIVRMLPHRRLGNRLLSLLLSWVARRRISDGQSGYRAFSPPAAAAAEIIHDFNYAQVLTLDLLAKGMRYREVPITYRWRTAGRSFVRLGRYLRSVVPAVYRELNRA
ncbi:MAG: glycosyltransferase family 2 protein, partial [Actinomycetota bacterium]